jgi:predicted RNase H-like nuclease (RuvC/YqgF family)
MSKDAMYELEELQEKIENAKNLKAKAEGAKEQVLSQLKKDFDLDSIEAAQAQIAELEQLLARDQQRHETLLKKLNEVTDWGEL